MGRLALVRLGVASLAVGVLAAQDQSPRPANASFYPIDPRGLPVFDQSITRPLTPGLGTPLAGFHTVAADTDATRLAARRVSLNSVASGTDGLAMLNNNDLSRRFRKIVDDLSSYYLLGYYSTGALDGRFHTITVRVKRPGVQVRARRGYLAGTRMDVTAAPAASQPIDRDAAAVTAAIAPLSNYARELPIRTQAAAGWTRGDPPAAVVWVEGELNGSRAFEELSKNGGSVTIDLTAEDGSVLATTSLTLARDERVFRVMLSGKEPLAAGAYVVRVTARTDGALPVRDTAPITIGAFPQTSHAMWWRRSLSTGNRNAPTADLRFRRNERVQTEVPTSAKTAGQAQLLDRSGKLLPVPVSTELRADLDGALWQAAALALAPLAPGDYIIELSDGGVKTLAAFKVTP